MKKLLIIPAILVLGIVGCADKSEKEEGEKEKTGKDIPDEQKSDLLYEDLKEFEASYSPESAEDATKATNKLMQMKMDVVNLNPEREEAPMLVFQSANHAYQLQQFKKAVSLCDRVISDYPESDKVVDALYFKAVILDLDLMDKEEAKKAYQSIIDRYADQEQYRKYVEDARARLENIDLSPEEIIERAKGESV